MPNQRLSGAVRCLRRAKHTARAQIVKLLKTPASATLARGSHISCDTPLIVFTRPPLLIPLFQHPQDDLHTLKKVTTGIEPAIS